MVVPSMGWVYGGGGGGGEGTQMGVVGGWCRAPDIFDDIKSIYSTLVIYYKHNIFILFTLFYYLIIDIYCL